MTLEFRHTGFAYERACVIKDVSFSLNPSEITCLLGPSGCGKTTLLRMAAGLLPTQSGEIWLNSRKMSGGRLQPAPEKRPVGLVFQDGALFPHMTVAQNISFGLDKNTVGSSKRVSELLEIIRMSGLGHRYPHTLSGGQQQRVAVARALAPSPEVMLLDEPFASLDMNSRRRLRRESRAILKNTRTTVMMVTHDPEEALEMSDRLIVLSAGQVQQTGTPDELYDHPVNPVVARIVAGAQSVSAERHGHRLLTAFGDWSPTCLANNPSEKYLYLLVREEMFQIKAHEAGNKITDIQSAGSLHRVTIRGHDGELLYVLTSRDHHFAQGQRVKVTPRQHSVHGFPSQGLGAHPEKPIRP
ncbi:MAG: ABC transporter ATP-binding protein [Hyphomonadaceae bacterium]|nr:ABC transporter ATP-binding protein [Hyphomonadaceae bacterium]MBC6411903.1 ABC transporter ATP-binding protein [Hyphomonadaceae bacterium]